MPQGQPKAEWSERQFGLTHTPVLHCGHTSHPCAALARHERAHTAAGLVCKPTYAQQRRTGGEESRPAYGSAAQGVATGAPLSIALGLERTVHRTGCSSATRHTHSSRTGSPRRHCPHVGVLQHSATHCSVLQQSGRVCVAIRASAVMPRESAKAYRAAAARSTTTQRQARADACAALGCSGWPIAALCFYCLMVKHRHSSMIARPLRPRLWAR
jgi:hypothetical protein